jgi:hypothetical protein
MIEGTPIQNARYEQLMSGINQMHYEDTEALRDAEKSRRVLAEYVIDRTDYEGWHSL